MLAVCLCRFWMIFGMERVSGVKDPAQHHICPPNGAPTTQRIAEVDVGGTRRIATARLAAGQRTLEWEHVLTAAVGWAACRLCSGAVKRLWRAVVDGRASTAVVVGWRCEGGNALVVGRHIELAAFAQAMGDGDLIRWRSRLSDPRTDLIIRAWPISLTPNASNHTLTRLESTVMATEASQISS